MAITRFSPGPGRYGESYITVMLQGVTGLTSAGVSTRLLPPHARLNYLKRVSFVASTVAAGTGNCTAVIRKVRIGGGTVDLTTPVSLFGRTANQEFWADLASGVVDADATVREGESLQLVITNTGGTITTQPVEFHVTVELAVLR